TYSKELTDNAIVYAEKGLPILFAPEVMGGASGPASLAGILAQQNAEFLGGVVIAQMAASKEHRPPLMYGTVSGVVDMRSGVFCLGTAETGLLNVGTAQLARFYNVPSRGTGGLTDAIVPDAQSGIESGITVLLAALAGHTYIYNATGATEPGVLAISYEKIVIDNDMLGLVTRVMGGIEVSDETLATDVIDEVVNEKGGNFLLSEHTRKHFRSHYYPEIFNRELWERWTKGGSLSVRQVARARAKKILEEHQPEPLDSDVEKRVREVITQIEKRELKDKA
ncbi:MAG: trimethylamine methyltransferase family protein, partial [Candidatus Hodarchaeota archaeon]